MGAEEVPHLIQPVAQAWTADRSLVSKRTRPKVKEKVKKSKTLLGALFALEETYVPTPRRYSPGGTRATGGCLSKHVGNMVA